MMDIMNIKEKVFEILNEMLGEDAEGLYCYDDVIEGAGEDFFYTQVCKNYLNNDVCEIEDVEIQHGVCKYVIIPNEGDYVIKLPIMGTFDYVTQVKHVNEKGQEEFLFLFDENDIDEAVEQGWQIVDSKIEAVKTMQKHNIMEIENDIYNNAPEILKDFLLPNIFIGYFNSIPVYIQRKISKTVRDTSSYSAITEADNDINVKTIRSESHVGVPSLFIKKNIEFFGFEKALKIMTAISDIKLEDLHTANLGYLEDGTPCVFDFGGYNEEEVWQY